MKYEFLQPVTISGIVEKTRESRTSQDASTTSGVDLDFRNQTHHRKQIHTFFSEKSVPTVKTWSCGKMVETPITDGVRRERGL